MSLKKTCPNGPIASFVLSSPIGDLKLTCCEKAVHSLKALSLCTEEQFHPEPKKDVVITSPLDLAKPDGYYNVASCCAKWLQKYFSCSKKEANKMKLPPICHLQEPYDTFQKRVWKTLAEDVKFGQVVSYAELASMSGSSSKASRAVGQAMRNNPVMIIVPCHRVVLSDGSIGNYGGGKWNFMKAWLLEHEKHNET